MQPKPESTLDSEVHRHVEIMGNFVHTASVKDA